LGRGPNSLRAKLEAAARQTGKAIEELEDLVELPDTMTFVWRYFIDLHNSRTAGAFGINPITFSDIKAYFDLNNVVPMDWEISAIKQLDGIALRVHAEEAEKESKKKTKTKK
jgi:hypothetical protein